MKNLIIISILLLAITSCYSQRTLKKSEQKILQFLITQGDFQPTEVNLNYAYVIGAIHSEGFNEKSEGFFRFGVSSSHAQIYFLLKTKTDLFIFDMLNLEETLLGVLIELKKSTFYSESEKLILLENIIYSYKKNKTPEVPWVDKQHDR